VPKTPLKTYVFGRQLKPSFETILVNAVLRDLHGGYANVVMRPYLD
jgi:hypothetical protein